MRKPYLIFSVLLFLLSLIIFYVSATAEANLRWLLDFSDHLFPFSIYNGIFNHAANPVWVFGGYTPFIELILGFLIWLPFKNIAFTYVFYAAIQVCLVTASAVYLAASIYGKNWKIFSLVLSVFSFVVIAASTGSFYSFNLLFYWYLHITTFALGLVALALLINFSNVRNNKKRFWTSLLLFSLVCAVGTASDALFISQFIAPAAVLMVCMLLFKVVSFRRGAIAILCLLYSTAIGLLLFNVPEIWGNKRMVLNGYYIQSALSNLDNNFRAATGIVSSIWQGKPLIAGVWISFYLICLLMVVFIIRRWLVKSGGIIRQKLGMGILFFLFQLITSLGAELISVEPASRYILPVIFIPLFAGWPIIASAFPRWTKLLRAKISFIPGALMFGIAGLFLITHFHSATLLPDVWNYYPEEVACLDANAARLDLHYGIAQYWKARPITLYSKTGLLVVQVMPNLEPFPILTNLDSYRHNFEFIVLDTGKLMDTTIDRDLVFQRFGEPAETFSCPSSEILVYNRASDAAFAHQFDGFNNGK